MNVLIAHGEPLIQIGLEGALGRCEDLRVQSPIRIETGSIDVAVTDLDIGLTLIRAPHANATNVLVVTSDESESSIRAAIEAGVRGYILQSSTLECVAQSVRRVAQGASAIDPRVLTKMLDSLKGERLTEREIDVLRLVALGRSDKAVANQLGMALGTAKHHMKHVLSKLNARSRTEAATIAQRRGLVPSAQARDQTAPVHGSIPSASTLNPALASRHYSLFALPVQASSAEEP